MLVVTIFKEFTYQRYLHQSMGTWPRILAWLLVLGPGVVTTKAQTAEQLGHSRTLNLADQAYREQRDTAALALLEQVLPNVEWGPAPWVMAAELAIRIGDTTRSLGYLERVYRFGGDRLLPNFPAVMGRVREGFWEPTLGELTWAREEWAAQVDSLSIHSLGNLTRTYWSAPMEQLDAVLDQFVALCDQRGFPVPTRLGDSMYLARSLLLDLAVHRGNDPRLLRCVQLARSEMQAGHLDPELLMEVEDLLELAQGRPMRTGHALMHVREWAGKEMLLLPEEELDANRAAWGLCPIREWIVRLRIPPDHLTFVPR